MRSTRRRKNSKFTYIFIAVAIVVLALIGLAVWAFTQKETPKEETVTQAYHVFVNNTDVGLVADPQLAKQWMVEARKEIASQSDELVFMEAEMTYREEKQAEGSVDEETTVKERIYKVLQSSIIETMQRSYTVKVNEYMANLSSEEEVKQLLEAAIGKYDTEQRFAIELVQDTEREFSVLQAQVVDGAVQADEKVFINAGISEQIDQMLASCEVETEKDFGDYELGLKNIGFSENIEIVEAYLPVSQMKPLDVAIQELTEEQEQQVIYEVQSGDTLSEIAITVDIPMEDIVAMNDSLEDVNSVLQIGQELIITVPEPELSVVRHEVNYYEEIYDEEIIYIDVDDWYTYEKEVIQQPSAGFRKVVVDETYVNEKQVSREILKEEVEMEAVAKIVKRGTKIPPTYIKPLSGGRTTSKFGPRKAPTKGASTYHKGHDWATPTGTPIYASCGGTVKKAGWGSGYGYVVYIDHTDGRQTRYAHLSKVLVKVGQTVKQGEKIALSGNTGVSTGPHLHFEMLIDGKQVNPIPYLN
ncbi:MAG: M23 family metallopeptidase [Lachnospiraceae bacterium]|nr:M23 family metallopeptidase [Lachnospiraceae bacterium]MBQ7777076.1 M23 family metallopeptidase [Lachnospiraceae bacterium]